MELSKDMMKVLSVESRMKMLKLLRERRMTGAEMAKRLKLSPSTVFEHLKKMEGTGIIKRVETGHKWVYYEIPEDQEVFVQPHKLHIVFSVLGLVFLGASSLPFFSVIVGQPQTEMGAVADKALAAPAAEIAPLFSIESLIGPLLLTAGIILLGLGLIGWRKQRVILGS